MEANDIFTYYQEPARLRLQNAPAGSQKEEDLVQTILLAEVAIQLAIMNTWLDSISAAIHSVSTALYLK